MSPSVLLTCEHAGNDVPRAYKNLFRGASRILASHRGWDPGSWEMGRVFRQSLRAPLLYTKTTRLLVEVNRSIGHPRLFSEFTSQLDLATKQEILARYYHSHRDRVEAWIAERLESDSRVIHVGMHTFTPTFNGEVRHADIGLLYDPRRSVEKTLCQNWHRAIHRAEPELRIRWNYPYRGNADGLTTHFRSRFGDERYLGVELEVNQRLSRSRPNWRMLAAKLAAAFTEVATDAGNPGV